MSEVRRVGLKLLGWLRVLLGVGLAVVLVVWVVARSGVQPLDLMSRLGVERFMILLALSGLGIVLVCVRWMVLLFHVQVRLTFWVTLRLSLIGLFFNLFVPGGVGGDLIKMVYLKKEAGSRYPQAILTVLLDRVIGLVGLLFLTLLALGGSWSLITTGPAQLQALLLVVAVACAGALGVCGAFWGWPYLAPKFGPRLSSWAERLRPGVRSIALRVGEALALLRAAPGTLWGLTALSMVVHLLATAVVIVVAIGVAGWAKLNLAGALLATQLGNLVSAVPITPGGVGNRDLVMSLLLSASGASSEVTGAVPLVVTLLLIFWSLVGGLVLAFERLSLRAGKPS